MGLAETLIVLVAIVIIVVVTARVVGPRGIPVPLALLVVGILLSFVPGMPELRLSPDLVLLGLLPPLLYAAANSTSLIDIRAYLTPILGLSVGLVLVTSFGVALVAWWLLPIPFAVAVALGAIVAPPDAVAATAVARRIGLPRRITTILEGESLLNDATALVTLRTALAVGGLTAHGAAAHGEAVEEVTPGSVVVDLLIAAVGGVAIGLLAYVLVAALRKVLTDAPADTALSFVVPFLAYIPAEEVGASGVLSVVTAGLLLAYRAPTLQSATSRLSERVNWSSVTFILENAVFLMIGLQVSFLLAEAAEGGTPTGTMVVAAVAVLAAVLILRPLWIVPLSVIGRDEGVSVGEAVRSALVTSWAGMRGVVTLAAALTLPAETPLRATLILIALVVTVGTLLLQGTTLPWLARTLDVEGPDPRADALAEATVLAATTGAGLRAIESLPEANDEAVAAIRAEASERVNRSWERLGAYTPGDDLTPAEERATLRVRMIHEERAELMRIRAGHSVDHQVLDGVLAQLDGEEAALGWRTRRAAAIRSSELRTPAPIAGACDHLQAAPSVPPPPNPPEGCQACLDHGMTWVHLRSCVTCGQVGCCDSSVGKHAHQHHRESGHAVMRSIEPGEAWRWCYVDETLG